ncbi:nucleotidyltransferase family protein [Bacteriovorax sp. PP10]|uniref:Nucleotidyltransferase family protein n=1 Tax=Bacteriovorax antarcticus TaxID=3088717 RepID=A0ABU5VX67_9BACT|nr:nucleotidyltransferase family protein [Bacteriovorax sp. PP10]MEA9357656.1 nucleotidyltransferase family protein [Bacteriovorax sp. PP10]
MSKVKIACLLLCAGKSSRMSPDHKLLLKIDNEHSILQRTAMEITRSQFYEIIAVTGFEEELVKAELKGLALEIYHNKNYENGLHSSIKEGLKHLGPQADYFTICLADQPMLSHKDYNLLIDTVNANPDFTLFRPVFNGRPGNPVVISKKYIPEILAHEDVDQGCFYLFEKYPEATIEVPMKNHSTLIDIDTPELFEEVRFHLKERE